MRTLSVTACTHVTHGAPASVHRPTHPISRAQPAHHWYGRGGWLARATHVIRHPAQGAARTPPPTAGARHTLLRVGQRASDVVRSPTPGGRGSPPIRGVVASVDGQRYCIAPTLVPTPQSRRKAPRQLPFQGSRGGVRDEGVGNTAKRTGLRDRSFLCAEICAGASIRLSPPAFRAS